MWPPLLLPVRPMRIASKPYVAAFARTQRTAAFVSWICAGHFAKLLVT